MNLLFKQINAVMMANPIDIKEYEKLTNLALSRAQPSLILYLVSDYGGWIYGKMDQDEPDIIKVIELKNITFNLDNDVVYDGEKMIIITENKTNSFIQNMIDSFRFEKSHAKDTYYPKYAREALDILPGLSYIWKLYTNFHLNPSSLISQIVKTQDVDRLNAFIEDSNILGPYMRNICETLAHLFQSNFIKELRRVQMLIHYIMSGLIYELENEIRKNIPKNTTLRQICGRHRNNVIQMIVQIVTKSKLLTFVSISKILNKYNQETKKYIDLITGEDIIKPIWCVYQTSLYCVPSLTYTIISPYNGNELKLKIARI